MESTNVIEMQEMQDQQSAELKSIHSQNNSSETSTTPNTNAQQSSSEGTNSQDNFGQNDNGNNNDTQNSSSPNGESINVEDENASPNLILNEIRNVGFMENFYHNILLKYVTIYNISFLIHSIYILCMAPLFVSEWVEKESNFIYEPHYSYTISLLLFMIVGYSEIIIKGARRMDKKVYIVHASVCAVMELLILAYFYIPFNTMKSQN